MGKLHLPILNDHCINASLVRVLLISVFTTSALADEKQINIKDVDIFSRGVVKLVRTEGQIDLAKDPRVVCEKRASLGSQMKKLTCMTKKEREVLKKDAEDELLQIQDAQERHIESLRRDQ